MGHAGTPSAIVGRLLLVGGDAHRCRDPCHRPPRRPPTPFRRSPATRPRHPARTPASPRPDIVVLVLDDIPELDGRLWTRLPNIRRLFVEQGLEFTDTHGETPTCCPGRAGFLTGLHTHHHGAYRDRRLALPARGDHRHRPAAGRLPHHPGRQVPQPLRARLPEVAAGLGRVPRLRWRLLRLHALERRRAPTLRAPSPRLLDRCHRQADGPGALTASRAASRSSPG